MSPGDPLLQRHLDADERRQFASDAEHGADEARALLQRARERARDALESGRAMRARIDQIADPQSRAHFALRRRLLDGAPEEGATIAPAVEAECAVAVRRLLRASRIEREAVLPVRRWARDVYRLTGTWIPPRTLMGRPAEPTTLDAVARSLSSRWRRLLRMGEARAAAIEARVETEGFRRVLLATQWIHLAELDRAWTEHLRVLGDLEATLGFRAFARGDALLAMRRDAHEAFLSIAPAVEACVVERLLAMPPLHPEVLQRLMVGARE